MKRARVAFEAVRTSPLGFMNVSVGLGVGVQTLATTKPEFLYEPINLYWLGFSAANLVIGPKLIKQHLKLRNRLERSIERHGFDERAFKPTTKTWCLRQVAHVACKKFGLERDYEKVYLMDPDRHLPQFSPL